MGEIKEKGEIKSITNQENANRENIEWIQQNEGWFRERVI